MHSNLMADSTGNAFSSITPRDTRDEAAVRQNPGAESPSGGQITRLAAENRELQAEVQQLRADRNRLLDLHRRMMELLGTTSPEKIVHDLRNVLNERNLLKALVDEL